MTKLILRVLSFFLSLVFVLLFFHGCGAPTGSGTDTNASVTAKVLTIESVLASDDLIASGNLRVGENLDDFGRVIPLSVGELLTDQNGKIGKFSVSVSPSTSVLWFEIFGGKSAIDQSSYSQNTIFGGVAEFGSVTIPRVNLSPFHTMISLFKKKNPHKNLSQLAIEAVSPFFISTSFGQIDVNSKDFTGVSSTAYETENSPLLFQTMNQLLKTSLHKKNKAAGAEELSKHVYTLFSESSSTLYSTTGSVFSQISDLSLELSTSPASYNNWFSTAISRMSTASGSFHPTGFSTNPADEAWITVGEKIFLDQIEGRILSVESGYAIVTGVSGSLSVSMVPESVSVDLSHNRWHPVLQTRLEFGIARSAADSILVTMSPVSLDLQNPVSMTMPSGALFEVVKREPGSTITVSVPNQSEDVWVSKTEKLDFPAGAWVRKGESAAGKKYTLVNGQVLDVYFRFGEGVLLKTPSQSSGFHGFRIPSLNVVN